MGFDMEAIIFLILMSTACQVDGFIFGKSEVCYEPYGCFDKKWPYDNTNDLPQAPEKIGLKPTLNNRANPDLSLGELLYPTDLNAIRNSYYNSSLKLVVIIHGFRGSSSDKWVGDMATEILMEDDVNVICVSWEDGADTLDYGQATANTRIVGKMMSLLLKNINSIHGTPFANMHVVGHSLGSHIAGYIGRFTPGLGRITGLDPAGPNFANFDPLVRLDPTDATFVEAIHSDADTLIELGFGLEKAVGDIDFYPNGGENQPGCSKHIFTFLQKLVRGEITDHVACSHMRAIYLFISSIRKCHFIGELCSSYDYYLRGNCYTYPLYSMGYWFDPNAVKVTGKYYLQTTGTAPYC